MLVKDLMQRDFCSCGANVTISDAAKAMIGANSGYLLVLEQGKLLGIVTESDFIQRTEGYRLARGLRIPHIFHQLIEKRTPLEQQYLTYGSAPVTTIMTKRIVTIGAEATLEALDALMDDRRLRRIPVLQGDQVVGIVTARELMTLTYAK